MILLNGKKASADQLLSSLFVLVGLFILMGLFVIVSSNVAYLKKVVSFSEPEPLIYSEVSAQSRALSDVFLNDQVSVNGKNVLVREAIGKIVAGGMNGGNSFDYSLAVQELFKKSYSCDRKNSLLIIQDVGSKERFGVYVDYPLKSISSEIWNGPSDIEVGSLKERVSFVNLAGVETIRNGYDSSGVYTTLISGNSNLYVVINGGATC